MSTTKEDKHPKIVKFAGHVYVAENVSMQEVQENINRAADRAAIENILENMQVHAGHVQEIAKAMEDAIEDESLMDEGIESLKRHSDVCAKFLARLKPTYSRFVNRHLEGGEKKDDKKSKGKGKEDKDEPEAEEAAEE